MQRCFAAAPENNRRPSEKHGNDMPASVHRTGGFWWKIGSQHRHKRVGSTQEKMDSDRQRS
jgi:hypothetical protein